MIPKIIHYCWFGKSPKNPMIENCIKSWKKNLKDYTIIEWNEDNFDLNINDYVKEAYENKKWAFVTDYVRLYAIYNYGGIYMDTDVEVLKNLDEFLNSDGFTGFEHEEGAITGIIASKKEEKVIGELLKYYEGRHFSVNGQLDLTTNVESVTKIFINQFDLKLNDKLQKLKDTEFYIYPKEYFCPKDYNTGKVNLTQNTYAIHHFNGSWVNSKDKFISKLRYNLKNILGEKIFKVITLPYRIYKSR